MEHLPAKRKLIHVGVWMRYCKCRNRKTLKSLRRKVDAHAYVDRDSNVVMHVNFCAMPIRVIGSLRVRSHARKADQSVVMDVPNCARIHAAIGLTDLQKGSPAKGAAIEWTDACQDAFDKIKMAVTSEPILKHAQMTEPSILDPDSSQYRIGAVLQQHFTDSDGKQRLHPIAYESKS